MTILTDQGKRGLALERATAEIGGARRLHLQFGEDRTLWNDASWAGIRSITEEIPPGAWDSAFATVNRRYRNWLVTIEQVGPETPYGVPAENRVLDGIFAMPCESGRAVLVCLASATPAAQAQGCVAVPEAKRVWLKCNENGTDEAVEIESADGTMTILYFSPPRSNKNEEP
jgi:hypothetical protein